MNQSTFRTLLLFVSFIEGGSLMAFEILSSKLYTPYLGSTIYVWTAILTITLLGLAIGYRIGGTYVGAKAHQKLKLALVIAALLVGISSFISAPILEGLLAFDVKAAAIMAGVMIIFLPVTAMGMVSPLIVELLSKNGTAIPTASGLVYGIGTFGGIFLLLLSTYVFIPEIGVRNSTFLLSGLLVLALVILFILKEKKDA
jgi:predicted membrane-bound spermidine synthase